MFRFFAIAEQKWIQQRWAYHFQRNIDCTICINDILVDIEKIGKVYVQSVHSNNPSKISLCNIKNQTVSIDIKPPRLLQ